MALLLGSMIFLLLVLEVLVRVVAPQPLSIFRPDVWTPVDGLGHRLAPNLDTHVSTGERSIRLFTDAHGHRTGDSQPSDPTWRILAIGDSYLEAMQVSYADTMTARLEQSLTKSLGTNVAIVNTGCATYNPNQYLMKAKRELATEKYHMMLVFICISNDIVTEKTNHNAPRKITMIREFRMPELVPSSSPLALSQPRPRGPSHLELRRAAVPCSRRRPGRWFRAPARFGACERRDSSGSSRLAR